MMLVEVCWLTNVLKCQCMVVPILVEFILATFDCLDQGVDEYYFQGFGGE